jgi:hypothetical protein
VATAPIPSAGAASRPAFSGRERLAALLGEEGLLLFLVCGYLAEQIALLRRQLGSDGWLTLVAGRQIVDHGLPSADHWTTIASGRSWVDQQWLAHLALYATVRIGGIPLALAVNLALAGGSLIGAAVLARKRGASSRVTAWVVLVALLPFGRSADVLRAQSLCYPLFVALVWVLTDPRAGRRIYLTFPLLVLWANLHGSVVVAAGLVSACGLLRLIRKEGARTRALALAAGPWACVFASPYALDLPRYYRATLFNPAFAHYVTEWKPVTLSLMNVPIFVLAAAAIIVVARRRTGWGIVEPLILCVCAVLAVLAVRNGVWLALASVLLLPGGVTRSIAPAPSTSARRRMNVALATGAAAALVLATVATAGRPASWFTTNYPDGAAAATVQAAGPSGGRVFATEDFADWLLWREPSLAGRIAYDDRLELLRSSELRMIFGLKSGYVSPAVLERSYSAVVADPTFAGLVRRRLGHRARTLYADSSVVVLSLAGH